MKVPLNRVTQIQYLNVHIVKIVYHLKITVPELILNDRGSYHGKKALGIPQLLVSRLLDPVSHCHSGSRSSLEILRKTENSHDYLYYRTQR